MSGNPNNDRRSVRRQETIDEIVRAAWELVREHGLAGLSLRDLGRRVGMRAQSLYSYVASKNDIYDAMFMEGYQALIDHLSQPVTVEATVEATGAGSGIDPAAAAKRAAHLFVEFCTVDPVRYQLLFQRTIPGFEPSSESWSVALRAYNQFRDSLAAVGELDQPALDLWTAVMTGLTSQQISNDPGGTRWVQLVDRAVDMLLQHINHPKHESEQS